MMQEAGGGRTRRETPEWGEALGTKGSECCLIEREDAYATVVTPWGQASELRQRRLYPGGGATPDEVARNQRERLFGAIVAVVAKKGYEATTVADVLALRGVSRRPFLRPFPGRSGLSGAPRLGAPPACPAGAGSAPGGRTQARAERGLRGLLRAALIRAGRRARLLRRAPRGRGGRRGGRRPRLRGDRPGGRRSDRGGR